MGQTSRITLTSDVFCTALPTLLIGIWPSAMADGTETSERLLVAGRDRGRSHCQGTLGFNEGLAPVAVAQAIDPDATAAAAAGMDELVIAQVDPGVTDTTATTIGGEEHHVTRLELVASNQRRLHVDHLTGGTRQIQARFLTEQITDEAAAVKTGTLVGTAETVAGADQGHAALENAVGQDWQLIRLAVGELGELFLGGQLIVQYGRRFDARNRSN